MPKLKTHSGAAILTSKQTNTKRKLAKSALVSDADLHVVLRMIPYA